MRSAAEFDAVYAAQRDPWGIARARRRDRALKSIMAPYIRGTTVLELGCGEGHLTATVLKDAHWVTAVDISATAIRRAPALPNARFQVMDLASPSLLFRPNQVITALECLYYLSHLEQAQFFAKLATKHSGIFIMSAPIIGGKYFTHEGLIGAFERYGLELRDWYNLNGYWKAGLGGFIARAIERLPQGYRLLAYCPERFIYQRCYVLRCVGSEP